MTIHRESIRVVIDTGLSQMNVETRKEAAREIVEEMRGACREIAEHWTETEGWTISVE